MSEELLENKKLASEYERVFDDEEKVVNALNLNADSYTLRDEVVNFSELSIPGVIKDSRSETYLGLSKSINEQGILSPIHVMTTEGYAEWLDSDMEEEFEGFKYILLDGFRRVYAGLKNGLNRCNAIVWDFKDKELGTRLLLPIHLILNKTPKHSWKEVWGMYQLLDEVFTATPGTMDYLLNLDPGDSLKLKAIMLCDYPEVKDELLSGKKLLSQSYNQLQKLLKEEDTLLKEDMKGVSEVVDPKVISNADKGTDNDEREYLSDQEVRDILEIDTDEDISDSEFGAWSDDAVPADRDDPKNRKPLDPKLRAAVLARDEYCSQTDETGKDLPINLAMGILHIHHLVPVHCGGTNELSNLITLDLNSHTLVHIIERNNGKVGISKEDFEKLPPERQTYYRRVMQIAKYAVMANRRLGRKKEDIKKDADESSKFLMPGVEQKINMDALKSVKE